MMQMVPSREAEDGFTLIELLVVIVIISILASIAIPVFINQRAKGFRAAQRADLRETAALMETYFTDFDTYPTQASFLMGVRSSPSNTLTVVSANASRYCVSVSSTKVGPTLYYASDLGGLLDVGVTCS
jgi:type IV pilus assembly protein PilA